MSVAYIIFDFSKSLAENALLIQAWYTSNPNASVKFIVKYDEGLMIHYS